MFGAGAIKFGAFRLKLHERKPDTPLSPIYIDLRVLRSFPLVMDSAVEVYMELIRGLKFDLFADVPTAATPIVAILSHLMKVPMVSPRKDDKEHGISRKIDGAFEAGQTALLIDDLITHAESKLETISTLKANGLTVKDVVVLVDREQGGAEQLETAGYTFHCAFKLSELLQFYRQGGEIDQSEYERTITYLRASSK
jgi:uridine monophosphate synthetase